MSSIDLNNVCLNLPVYNQSNFSFKALVGKISNSSRLQQHKHAIVVEALRDVSLSLKSGDALGLIGCNGAGKTTLLKIIAGIYKPSIGSLKVQGSISCILGTGFGMEEDATGYENIFLLGLYLGISRLQMRTWVDEIIQFAELEAFIYFPIRTYSSGMRAKLSFAIATCYEPEILVIDEGIGAGDAAFMHKAQKRLHAFMKKANILVLASHSNTWIQDFCKQAAWMDQGKLRQLGPMQTVLDAYMNSTTA